MIGYAVRYYLDFVAPHQVFRAPTAQETRGMARLIERLRALPAGADPETIQFEFYVQNDDGGPQRVTLKSVAGPDDDGNPCVTIMLPDED